MNPVSTPLSHSNGAATAIIRPGQQEAAKPQGDHTHATTVTREATSLPGDGAHSAAYVWYVILILSVVNVFNYMDRMALSVLMPSIQAELQLSDGQLGLLVGFAFFLFYAVCGVPVARWADRGTRRDIIALALATWSVMTALSGAAQNFWHLLLARIGLGVGEAGCLPAANSILCDYVPLRRRSGVYAIHNFGLSVGMMLGMALAGMLGEMIGWRWTFVVLGLPGIALALVIRVSLREPTRGYFELIKDDQASASFGATLRYLWGCRTYRMLMFYLIVAGFVQFGLMQWWPSFQTRVYGVGMSRVGAQLGLAIGIGSGIGLLLGGLIANIVAQRNVRAPLLLGTIATAVSLVTAPSSLFVNSALASTVFVSLSALLWNVSSGPIIAMIYSVARPRMRATAGTVTIFFTSILGFGLGPLCVGVLSDMLTPSLGAEAIRYALLAPVGFIPLMVISLYAAARDLPADLRAAGGQVEDDTVANKIGDAALSERS